MKNFPFRLLFVCMFLPSVCYILKNQMLQRYLHKGKGEYLGGGVFVLRADLHKIRIPNPKPK
jgi:hypothetical protein